MHFPVAIHLTALLNNPILAATRLHLLQAMSDAFGRPVDEVFSILSPKPVAAASLGQVYKGRLKPEFGGREVAVKVQRPGVLEQVCLDLYLMRQAAAAISALPEVRQPQCSMLC